MRAHSTLEATIVYLQEENEGDPLVEVVVLLPVADWVEGLHPRVSPAVVAEVSHLLLLLPGGRPVSDALLVLDGEGAVGPAVGVHQALVLHPAHSAVDGAAKVLSGGQHQGEENQDREGYLVGLYYFI